jgi:hypothetical protein
MLKLDKKLDKVGASPVTKHSKVYWRDRVYRPAQSDNYCVRMSSGGVQRSLSLRTPNREAAAETARTWFVFLSTNGWDAFDAKYRSAASLTSSTTTTQPIKSSNVAVGDFLSAVYKESDLAHRTIDGYARCLRLIDRRNANADQEPCTVRSPQRRAQRMGSSN